MATVEQRKPEGGLLQSQGWAGVYRAEGKQIVRINDVYGIVQNVPVAGQYLYVPRTTDEGVKNMQEILTEARGHGCAWVRTDVSTQTQLEQLQNLKIAQSPHDMQPREHFIIDISKDEEELLKQMKSKTRYNVRLAQKKGVVVHYITRSDEDFDQMFDIFFDMVEETGKRKDVSFHKKEHYRNMFDELSEKTIALYLAEVGGEFIAANIVTFYGNTATYLHGATSDTHRNLMAPFLLQWQAILGAHKRGLKHYDFGGVYSDTQDNGKTGITRFKKGFAPQEEIKQLKGSYDIIISPAKYYLYRILQKLKSLRG